jgi:hypothetical protein
VVVAGSHDLWSQQPHHLGLLAERSWFTLRLKVKGLTP